MAGAGVVSESIDRGSQQKQALMHCAVRVRIDIGSVVGVAKPIAVNALVSVTGKLSETE